MPVARIPTAAPARVEYAHSGVEYAHRVEVAPSGVEVERATEYGEHIVTLDGATLHSFAVLQSGLGFNVVFTIPLTEAAKLEPLSVTLHRIVDIDIRRVSRKGKKNRKSYVDSVYEGVEDEEDDV